MGGSRDANSHWREELSPQHCCLVHPPHSEMAPAAARTIRRGRKEQGSHIRADAAERVLPGGEPLNERKELMARHFVDSPELGNRIAVLVHPQFAVRILLRVNNQKGGRLPPPLVPAGRLS